MKRSRFLKMATVAPVNPCRCLLLVCLIIVGARALPTESPKTVQSSSEAVHTSDINTSTPGTANQNVSLIATDHGISATIQETPGIVNNENVTETEIVITEARHGKSLNHQNIEHEFIINKDNFTNLVTTTQPGPANFTAKLAQDADPVVQDLGNGDAPPSGNGEEPGKPADLQEPRLSFVSSTAAVPTERDRMIQKIFGGECDFATWNRCSRLKFWGGDYLVPDKNNPGQFIVRHHKIRCVESPGYTVCLKNGWTVARCHMLCMSQCNTDYRMSFEKLVLHEGDCRFPLLLK